MLQVEIGEQVAEVKTGQDWLPGEFILFFFLPNGHIKRVILIRPEHSYDLKLLLALVLVFVVVLL